MEQINTTTTQVQGVHDKKARRPSRILRQEMLLIAKELTDSNKCKSYYAHSAEQMNFCPEKLDEDSSKTTNLKIN